MYYKTIFYRLSRKGSASAFKVVIEEPSAEDSHLQLFEQLSEWGYECYVTPLVLDGKVYDECFHDSLSAAQSFCKHLGYKLNEENPHEGTWNGKVFRVR